MRVKFKHKVEKAKGACLHPKNAWVAVGLGDGSVEVWDYIQAQKRLSWRAHTGPVRTLCYHPSQPLLATGGDDGRVKVWPANVMEITRVKFSLAGHTDYVRCLLFSTLHPWLFSGSDDCSICVWNWQSRSLLSTIHGHTHWVTSLSLHPSLPFLLSSSLDGSARLWDYSSLAHRTSSTTSPLTAVDTLFGALDVATEQVWEGFQGSISFALFHPTLPLVCVAESWQIRVYSLKTRLQVRSLGQEGGVVAGTFTPEVAGKNVSLATLGKANRLRLWDVELGLCRFSMETEWSCQSISATPPTSNPSISPSSYVASIAKEGVSVYKLWKERPAFTCHQNSHLYYSSGGQVRHLHTELGKEKLLVKLMGMKEAVVTSLEYNATEHSILVASCIKGLHHSYQLYTILEGAANMKPRIQASVGRYPTWLSNNKFAILDKQGKLVIKNLQNQDVNFGGFARGFLLPKTEADKHTFRVPNCSRIFAGGRKGTLLLQDGDTLVQYDTEKKRRIASCCMPGVTRVIWSQDSKMVAFLGRLTIWLCNSSLSTLHTITVRTPVKSGVWCMHTSAFIFSTELQIRYALPCGEEGSLLSLPKPLYIASIDTVANRMAVLDREGKPHILSVTTAEYRFKAAVVAGREQEAVEVAKTGKLLGQGLLKFLASVGKPELALAFIQDPLSRFCLAEEAGDLRAAEASAASLDSTEIWARLSSLAMLHGDPTVAESAMMKGGDTAGLSLLYTVTGQLKKLKKLARLLSIKGEASQEYRCLLLLGDVEGRTTVLEKAGQHELASLTHQVHNLGEDCAEKKICDYGHPTSQTAQLLLPPPPLLAVDYPWPMPSPGLKSGEIVKEGYRDLAVGSS